MESAPLSLSWVDLVTLTLGSGLVATIAGQVIGGLLDRMKSKRLVEVEATHLASRLAVMFEYFAIQCAESIADNDMYNQSGGHMGRMHTALPELNEFPSQVNWSVLDPHLLSRSLSLPNEISLGRGMILHWADLDMETDSVRNACDAQAGVLGYRTWQLAEDLRNRYKLPDFSPKEFSWDTRRTLKKHHDKELQRIKDDQSVEC